MLIGKAHRLFWARMMLGCHCRIGPICEVASLLWTETMASSIRSITTLGRTSCTISFLRFGNEHLHQCSAAVLCKASLVAFQGHAIFIAYQGLAIFKCSELLSPSQPHSEKVDYRIIVIEGRADKAMLQAYSGGVAFIHSPVLPCMSMYGWYPAAHRLNTEGQLTAEEFCGVPDSSLSFRGSN